jgi:hypothetical protein
MQSGKAVPQVGAPEAVAETEGGVVECTYPGRVHKVVDHVGRLPGSQPGRLPTHWPEGRSGGRTAPDGASSTRLGMLRKECLAGRTGDPRLGTRERP